MGPLEAVLSLAILAILAAILWPVNIGNGQSARRTLLYSNLKRIGTTVQIYLTDYDDLLPFIEPYEFGDDALGPYLSHESVYENPYLTREGIARKPKTTQHEFRFVFAPMILENDIWMRKVVDVTKAPNLEKLPIVWSEAKTGASPVCILFADTHVASRGPDKVDAQMSPGLLGQTNLLFGRLNYIPKNAEWPPPTWSLPIQDVVRYADQAKKDAILDRPGPNKDHR